MYLVNEHYAQGNLATRLCLCNQDPHCFRTCLRMPTLRLQNIRSTGQQPAQLQKEFPRIHNVGHSINSDAHMILRVWYGTIEGMCEFVQTRTFVECCDFTMIGPSKVGPF